MQTMCTPTLKKKNGENITVFITPKRDWERAMVYEIYNAQIQLWWGGGVLSTVATAIDWRHPYTSRKPLVTHWTCGSLGWIFHGRQVTEVAWQNRQLIIVSFMITLHNMQDHGNSLKLILNLQSGGVKPTKCGAAYVFKYLTAVVLRVIDGFHSANTLISCKSRVEQTNTSISTFKMHVLAY